MHMTGDGFGWALLISIGAFAGFCSGLLGIGGGVVIIPAVIFTGPQIGITSPDLAKIAMASSSLWILRRRAGRRTVLRHPLPDGSARLGIPQALSWRAAMGRGLACCHS
jgi:hypothetical protein